MPFNIPDGFVICSFNIKENRLTELSNEKTLINIETGLCYEMTDYIYEIFLEEMRD